MVVMVVIVALMIVVGMIVELMIVVGMIVELRGQRPIQPRTRSRSTCTLCIYLNVYLVTKI